MFAARYAFHCDRGCHLFKGVFNEIPSRFLHDKCEKRITSANGTPLAGEARKISTNVRRFFFSARVLLSGSWGNGVSPAQWERGEASEDIGGLSLSPLSSLSFSPPESIFKVGMG